jgi:hypothetical protein
LTGGIYPSDSTVSSRSLPQTWQHSTATLPPEPAARAIFAGFSSASLDRMSHY